MTASMTINGIDYQSVNTMSVINPATGEVFAQAPDAGAEELDAAIAAARSAFPSWSKTPLEKRQAIVTAIADVIDANTEELSRLLTTEQGKPSAQAIQEVGGAAFWLRSLATIDIPVSVLEDTPERKVEMHRTPLGVVGAISPWNYPVTLSLWKVAFGLLAGNTVVLKPSPLTPLTLLRIGELCRDIVPNGVLNIITGGDHLGPLMTCHPGFDKISFTGSTATGRKVMESAAPTLKRITLELGGNDAAIVFPDVNVKETAENLFWASFTNSGQICVATKRAYVHDDIYDEFKQALINIAKTVPMGNGSDAASILGPVQNAKQYQHVNSLIKDCEDNGYTAHSGSAPQSNGFFIPVTIVDNPPQDSRIVQEEQFGPILPLIRFTDEDDAIEKANDSEYGLAGSVWCKDEEKATRVASQLITGTVWINEALALSPMTPFAGQKQSGMGVENGLEGILEYTNIKVVTMKRSG